MIVRFKIAAIQMESTRDKEANLLAAERLIREAASAGALLVSLPEMFNFLALDKESLKNAEPVPGQTTDLLASLAKELSVFIHGGSILQVSEDATRVYNTTVLLGPDGQILDSYSKLHLSDIRLAKDATLVAERDIVRGGRRVVVVETPLGRLGMSICFDIRFPELYRLLTLEGAHIIFVPSAFTMFTGKDHWEVLLRARAIENQVYVVAAGQVGTRSPSEAYYGRSLIVDPWGTVLSKAPDREAVVIAEVDLRYVQQIRDSLPSLKCRRSDVYALSHLV